MKGASMQVQLFSHAIAFSINNLPAAPKPSINLQGTQRRSSPIPHSCSETSFWHWAPLRWTLWLPLQGYRSSPV